MSRLLIAAAVAAVGAPTFAAAATPFPAGYDAAYKAYVAALPPAGRTVGWLARLNGVASAPAAMTLGGKPVTYLFSCKEHDCADNSANVFLSADKQTVRAAIKIKGVQSLIGGAGPAEAACVAKIDANHGAATTC